MTSRKRNYKAEYQRRLQLAKERGLSTAQARGHARKNEAKVSELKSSGVIDNTRRSTMERFYQVIKGVASGKSLSKSTKDAHISPATIKKLNAVRHILHRDSDGKSWSTQSTSHFPILTKDGKLIKDAPLDTKNASTVGSYWNAAHKASMGDTKNLATFSNLTVFDMNGNNYRLLTSVDDLISILDQMSDADREEYERSFASEQRAFRVMNHAT